MKICIYIPGLGEAFNSQSVLSYATRFMHELDNNNPDPKVKYELKVEKIKYADSDEAQTNKVSIIEIKANQRYTTYQFYDFSYTATLTSDYKSYNVLIKSLFLGVVILKKLPLVFWRLFFPSGTGYFMKRMRLQSFYAFLLLTILALGGMFLLPSAIGFIVDKLKPTAFANMVWLKRFFDAILSLSALLIALVPTSKDLISSLATEFVCVNYYLETGSRKQAVLGRFDSLIEYIYQNENPDKLHMHAYSFGSIIALDYIFPNESRPPMRLTQFMESFITIGCPYEFISTYYTDYFKGRNISLAKQLKWYNVFSSSDALASNFRRDAQHKEAEYTFANSNKADFPEPINVPYEIIGPKGFSIVNFLLLYFLRAHSMYWDHTSDAQSCERNIYYKLKDDNLLTITPEISNTNHTNETGPNLPIQKNPLEQVAGDGMVELKNYTQQTKSN